MSEEMKNARPEASAVNFRLHSENSKNWWKSLIWKIKLNYPDWREILSSLSSIDCSDVTFMFVWSKSRHFWYCDFSEASLPYRFSCRSNQICFFFIFLIFEFVNSVTRMVIRNALALSVKFEWLVLCLSFSMRSSSCNFFLLSFMMENQ